MKARDMTTGKPLATIIIFALPIMVGILLQQAYNLVDAVVVGQFIGTDAFGAASASNTLLNVFVAVLVGLGTGASIVISQYFGAGKHDKLKLATSTTLIVLSIIALAISVVGFFMARTVLVWFAVDSLILDDATAYLKIVFLGLFPLFVYNLYTGLLRGIGNSVAPLIFLLISTAINIVLDILFVAVFNMGVPGVAIATVIAYSVSAIISVVYTQRKIPLLHLSWKDLKYDSQMLKRFFVAGAPSILSNLLVSLSLVLLQGLFNGYGKDFTSAYGLSGRVDGLITIPMTALSNALATFVAQNKGADKPERIREGYWKTEITSSIITCVVAGLAVLFLDDLLPLFIRSDSLEASETVVKVTKEFVITLAPFYFIMGLQFGTTSVLSGASDIKAPIIIMVSSMVLRVIFAYSLSGTMGYFSAIWAFPFSWTIGATLAVGRFIGGKWKTKHIIREKEEANAEC